MEETRPKRLVALAIPPALIEGVDLIAKRQFKSRSEVIRQAVLHELEKEGVCHRSLDRRAQSDNRC
jgi:metal-responsive CopG/Arc/MetJ family transcriptional regulator